MLREGMQWLLEDNKNEDDDSNRQFRDEGFEQTRRVRKLEAEI